VKRPPRAGAFSLEQNPSGFEPASGTARGVPRWHAEAGPATGEARRSSNPDWLSKFSTFEPASGTARGVPLRLTRPPQEGAPARASRRRSLWHAEAGPATGAARRGSNPAPVRRSHKRRTVDLRVGSRSRHSPPDAPCPQGAPTRPSGSRRWSLCGAGVRPATGAARRGSNPAPMRRSHKRRTARHPSGTGSRRSRVRSIPPSASKPQTENGRPPSGTGDWRNQTRFESRRSGSQPQTRARQDCCPLEPQARWSDHAPTQTHPESALS
jgi:hypothetical protein